MRVGGFVVDCCGKVMDFSVDTVVKKINIFGWNVECKYDAGLKLLKKWKKKMVQLIQGHASYLAHPRTCELPSSFKDVSYPVHPRTCELPISYTDIYATQLIYGLLIYPAHTRASELPSKYKNALFQGAGWDHYILAQKRACHKLYKRVWFARIDVIIWLFQLKATV